MSHQTGSRNPRGLETRKPISLRLMPAELEQAEDISAQLNITKSKLARDAYLAGLPIVIQRFSTSAAAETPSLAADFTGGEAQASPAGLSSHKA